MSTALSLAKRASGPGHTFSPTGIVRLSPPGLPARCRTCPPRSLRALPTADLALQAAVLAYGIAEKQPFIDGNKRTALVAMLTFLEINGSRVRATDPELAGWIISLNDATTPEDPPTRCTLASAT